MKKTAKNFTYLDAFILLAAVLLLSVVAYSVSGLPRAAGETTVRVYVQYSPLTEGEALPLAGEALLDGEGREIGEVLAVSREPDGTIFVQGRIRSRDGIPSRGSDFSVETRTQIRTARVVEAYEEGTAK